VVVEGDAELGQEIERIDAQLEHFQGRIRREAWVQSAKEQYYKKYGKQI